MWNRIPFAYACAMWSNLMQFSYLTYSSLEKSLRALLSRVRNGKGPSWGMAVLSGERVEFVERQIRLRLSSAGNQFISLFAIKN